MRKKIVAGNWKMNTDLNSASDLAKSIASHEIPGVNLIVFPPFPFISRVSEDLKGSNVSVGAQNIHHESSGAFTGEVSAGMVISCGAQYVLIGHSERRKYFGEDNDLLAKKINKALSLNLKVVFCIGELLEDRNSGNQEKVVEGQMEILKEIQFNPENLIIAYEPVWAIGTGLNASADQAQEMHAFIRSVLSKKDMELSENISILYGGSCTPENASSIFSGKDVDGGLIGGASLKPDSFIKIAKSFNGLH